MTRVYVVQCELDWNGELGRNNKEDWTNFAIKLNRIRVDSSNNSIAWCVWFFLCITEPFMDIHIFLMARARESTLRMASNNMHPQRIHYDGTAIPGLHSLISTGRINQNGTPNWRKHTAIRLGVNCGWLGELWVGWMNRYPVVKLRCAAGRIKCVSVIRLEHEQILYYANWIGEHIDRVRGERIGAWIIMQRIQNATDRIEPYTFLLLNIL